MVEQLIRNIYGEKMKIIGITGKSGAGKTTLANQLKRDLEESGLKANIYSLDNMGKEIKDRTKKFWFVKKLLMASSSNKTTTKVMDVNNSFVNIFRRVYNAILIKLFSRKTLQREIDTAIREGKDYLIVEGCLLGRMINRQDLLYTIEVKKPYWKRREHLRKKWGAALSKRELVYRDKQQARYNKGFSYDEIIENNGTKEEFLNQVSSIIARIREKEIPANQKPIEQYRVEGRRRVFGSRGHRVDKSSPDAIHDR